MDANGNPTTAKEMLTVQMVSINMKIDRLKSDNETMQQSIEQNNITIDAIQKSADSIKEALEKI